jgi:DNA-directed RNA polymerase specialized sigma24 family protein
MARYVVLDGVDPGEARRATDVARARGLIVVPGWDRAAGSGTVCVGTVATDDDAAAAVLAAVGGADLVVSASAARDIVDRLCDDLRRLGEVDHRVGAASSSLDVEDEYLLALLLGGADLGQAARTLHVSRRTADRRLARARAALDVTSTPAALREAARRGIRPATPRAVAPDPPPQNG